MSVLYSLPKTWFCAAQVGKKLLWLLESWIVLAWVSEWAILSLWPYGKFRHIQPPVQTFGCNQATWNAQDILLPQEIGIVPDQWAANEIPKSELVYIQPVMNLLQVLNR